MIFFSNNYDKRQSFELLMSVWLSSQTDQAWDFEHLRWLLTLNKLKKVTTKLPWEKLDACTFLFLVFFLAIASCHRHSTLASQTCEGLHQLWALPRNSAFVFECLGNSLSCDLRDTIPRQRSPTLMLREACASAHILNLLITKRVIYGRFI